VSRPYDLVVLGGGTAGLVSSVIAAGIGARVALVERERTGGDCLWTGCVPSKSLIAAAQLAHRMRHAEHVGLTRYGPGVMARVHRAIAIEPHDSPARLRAEGVEVIEGEGRFVDRSTLEIGERRIRFASAIIATGSEPAVPPLNGLGGPDVLTTETFWAEREMPSRLVVLGGGPIGCELGQALARLGPRVVLVELAERLLLKVEPAAGALIAERLAADGVDVRLRPRAVEGLRAPEGPPALMLEGPTAVRPCRSIASSSRRGGGPGPRASGSTWPASRSTRAARSSLAATTRRSTAPSPRVNRADSPCSSPTRAATSSVPLSPLPGPARRSPS